MTTTYEFDDFRFDGENLYKSEQPIELSLGEKDVLGVLLDISTGAYQPNRVVSRRYLSERLRVPIGSISTCVSSLRKKLGKRYIPSTRYRINSSSHISVFKTRNDVVFEEKRDPLAAELFSPRVTDKIKAKIIREDLSELQADYILKTCLVTDQSLDLIAVEINKKYPELVAGILIEAVSETTPNIDVRANGAYLLGILPTRDKKELLLDLILRDQEPVVRKAAAISWAKFGNLNSIRSIFAQLNQPELRLRALQTLTWIHESMDGSRFSQFQKQFREMPLLIRVSM